MVYSGSTADLRLLVVLAGADWFSTSAVFSLYNFLLSSNFSIVAIRSEGLSLLAGLRGTHPYSAGSSSADTRFGATATSTYITFAHPVWARLFSQLSSALSYKERQIERNALTEGSLLAAASAQYLAQQAFSAALAEFARLLWSDIGVFDRTSFESQLSLTWS